ncbi:hypothetical protein [Pedobacter borealis]|uniref:hypothetical protein n=1 Tax=Pedobacter borealis TaxID=475254 RepID=UPI0012F9854E|nr:hypothetical protein [Pedobacter borealis]
MAIILQKEKPSKNALINILEGLLSVIEKSTKAKDPPWDAVLMGSVASTVSANLVSFFGIIKYTIIFFIKVNIGLFGLASIFTENI